LFLDYRVVIFTAIGDNLKKHLMGASTKQADSHQYDAFSVKAALFASAFPPAHLLADLLLLP